MRALVWALPFILFACSSGDGSASTGDGGDAGGGGDETSVIGEDSGAPSSDTGTTSANDSGNSGDPLADDRTLCVDTINAYRATLSLPPYVGWTSAESCADGQAKSDSESGTAHGAFGKCGEHAQDECPGWPGPPDSMIKSCLQMMWNEGPGSDFSKHGHYINMSSTSYTMASCGFYQTPSGSWWAVQDFK